MALKALIGGCFVPIALLAALLRQALLLRHANQQADMLVSNARAFERATRAPRARVLVLGDSTGVGVGADQPEFSLAGLIAADFSNVDIVNACRSGAKVADVLELVRTDPWERRRFDLILVHAGGNDVLYGTPLHNLARDADAVLQIVATLGRRVVWLGPPNLGTLPLFLSPVSWWMTQRSRKVCRILADATARHGAAFVSFFREKGDDPCTEDPQRFFAADGFHPSTEYYRYAYDVLAGATRLDAWLQQQARSKRALRADRLQPEPTRPDLTRPDLTRADAIQSDAIQADFSVGSQ